jgi:hypothetical protein
MYDQRDMHVVLRGERAQTLDRTVLHVKLVTVEKVGFFGFKG